MQASGARAGPPRSPSPAGGLLDFPPNPEKHAEVPTADPHLRAEDSMTREDLKPKCQLVPCAGTLGSCPSWNQIRSASGRSKGASVT